MKVSNLEGLKYFSVYCASATLLRETCLLEENAHMKDHLQRLAGYGAFYLV